MEDHGDFVTLLLDALEANEPDHVKIAIRDVTWQRVRQLHLDLDEACPRVSQLV